MDETQKGYSPVPLWSGDLLYINTLYVLAANELQGVITESMLPPKVPVHLNTSDIAWLCMMKFLGNFLFYTICTHSLAHMHTLTCTHTKTPLHDEISWNFLFYTICTPSHAHMYTRTMHTNFLYFVSQFPSVLAPNLGKLFPDMMMQLVISATQPPVAAIDPTGALVNATGIISVQVSEACTYVYLSITWKG